MTIGAPAVLERLLLYTAPLAVPDFGDVAAAVGVHDEDNVIVRVGFEGIPVGPAVIPTASRAF